MKRVQSLMLQDVSLNFRDKVIVAIELCQNIAHTS